MINYKLELLLMKIYSVFHIFLLKQADLKTLLQSDSSEINSESQNTEFKIEKILRK